MIPRTFTLVNREWMVRVVTSKQLQRHLDHHWNQDCDKEERLTAKHIKGFCDPDNRRIFVNKDRHTSEADMQHTYWHEFVHAVLFANGESGHDEEWVDRIGGFLHQYETTKEYFSED